MAETTKQDQRRRRFRMLTSMAAAEWSLAPKAILAVHGDEITAASLPLSVAEAWAEAGLGEWWDGEDSPEAILSEARAALAERESLASALEEVNAELLEARALVGEQAARADRAETALADALRDLGTTGVYADTLREVGELAAAALGDTGYDGERGSALGVVRALAEAYTSSRSAEAEPASQDPPSAAGAAGSRKRKP